MTNTPSSIKRLPSFSHALLTFMAIIITISVGMFIFNVSLHSLLLIAILIASISAYPLSKHGFADIRNAMNNSISQALSAVYIFILIGILIAALIQAGTVQTLILYGLDALSPAIFLPAGLVLCCLMSLATGTSWGTAGTAGIVLIGLGDTMGIPLPIVAGMVISGACFGDKMSPVSDTTNLSAMAAETNLYQHIRSMAYTTIPAFVITLIIFTMVGADYAGMSIPLADIDAMKMALNDLFTLNALTLLPLLVLITLSMKKVPAEPTMFFSAVTAVFIAIIIQDADTKDVLNALYSGGQLPATRIEQLDNLLGRGGITSMMWTLSLALLALALGGLFHTFGFLSVLMHTFLKSIKRGASLVATTIISAFTGNMIIGEAYMSIILGGQLFGKSYDEKGYNRSVLSRSLEEGATLTTPLIPWTTGGAFFAATLGVDTLEYIPWALLNWINPILSIALATTGYALFKRKQI